ncbi:protein MIX23 [Ischnura elegans]|uniref:protein MIX23 n=1 Tax=Ischnura elegans TaxID=197161 RepID=UPI001ED890D0|nr:protein MIX23 [Ischnura elegans]
MAAPTSSECDDFLEFQEALKKMREFDDKIVYALNTSLPTESFKANVDSAARCKDLFGELQSNYEHRESSIKKCISVVADKVRNTKTQRETNPDDINLLKILRKDQTKLRLLQAELNVEEVVKERSMKVYNERCRSFYKIPDKV